MDNKGTWVKMQTNHGSVSVWFPNHGKKEAVRASKIRFPHNTGYRAMNEGE